MTSAGPLRWTGGLRADVIGYGITGEWEAYPLADTIVVPVPEYEAVAFMFNNAAGSKTLLWDTNRERWSGHFDGGAFEAATTIRDPATGKYELAAFRANTPLSRVVLGRLSGRRAAFDCVARTGAEIVPGHRDGIPRAVHMSGAFEDAGAGSMRVRAPAEDADSLTLALAAALPAGGNEGDEMYLQAADGRMHVREDGVWRPVPGLGRGYIEAVFDYGDTDPTRYLDAMIECNWDPDFALDVLAIEYLD